MGLCLGMDFQSIHTFYLLGVNYLLNLNNGLYCPVADPGFPWGGLTPKVGVLNYFLSKTA